MTAPTLIVGPNLAFDRLATIDGLRPGEVLRFADVQVQAGGKGVNAARAALALGRPSTLVAFRPGRTGRVLAEMIAEEGIALRAVACGGEQRVATTVREASGRTTVLNEPGPPVSAAEWAALEEAVSTALDGAGAVLCSGSLPPGAPADGYARVAVRAASAELPVVVDASGELLAAALPAGPDVVVPALGEAALALGEAGAAQPVDVAGDARPRACALARALRERGARAAVVTAGALGAAFADGVVAGWASPPGVEARGPIGAGDCFAIAMAHGVAEGRPLADCVRWATAVAAASVETPRPGAVRLERARALAPRVAIEVVEG
jgi:1-phosphofructokinase family hexose kinase